MTENFFEYIEVAAGHQVMEVQVTDAAACERILETCPDVDDALAGQIRE